MRTYLIYDGEKYINQKIEIDSWNRTIKYCSTKIDISRVSCHAMDELLSQNSCTIGYEDLTIVKHWSTLHFISGPIDVEIDFRKRSNMEEVLTKMRSITHPE